MDLQELQELQTVTRIGRVLLEKNGGATLEAFSENALYCWRGMPTMKKYMTVKEVCELTGLTRKHLYYFHHEKVVQAAGFSTYSVEGNDGYKLYDEEAVEKLQQIALYYQLGLKRNEIRDLMLDPGYDCNAVLQKLLELELKRREQADRHIAALEYLKMTGTKNGLIALLNGIPLEKLGQTLLLLQTQEGDPPVPAGETMRILLREVSGLLEKLKGLEESERMGPSGERIMEKLFAMGKQHLGNAGVPFVLGLFVSAVGEGTAARETGEEIPTGLGKAVIRYIAEHPELSGSASEPVGCK